MIRLARLALVAAGSLGLAWSGLVSAQEVFLVDDDVETGDFTTLQSAVNAVPAGSILVVRTGAFNEIVFVDGKPLTITKEPGAEVFFLGQVIVRNLAPGETFVLQDLDVMSFGNTNETLQLLDNAGTVWVENVSIAGGFPNVFSSADTLVVVDSASVVLVDCAFVGGQVGVSSAPGGAGVRVDGSSVHAWDCTFVGGIGSGSSSLSAPGGPGVRVLDGLFFAAESTLRGGDGSGGGNVFLCVEGGDGGPGIELSSTTSTAFLVNGTLAGGSGGVPVGPGTCSAGSDGSESVVLAGNLYEAATPPHAFQLTSPVPTGAKTQLDFVGAPGEVAWALFSDAAGTLYLPNLLGTVALAFPPLPIPVGTLDASGTATLSLTAPAIPGGAEAADFFLQALFFDGLTFTLAEPAALVVSGGGG